MSEQNPTVRNFKRGPVPLGQNALELLKGHLNKRGFAQIEIVTRWSEIAGQGLSAHCVPQKLSSGANGSATLTLLADDRASLELQHQAPKLIERINRYFGRDVVGKIKVVAGVIPKPRTAPQLRRLTAAEENDLQSWTAGIEDPQLREALTRLGRNALAESRKTAVLKR
jgi:hypothetical protein